MPDDTPEPDYALLDRAGAHRTAFYPRPDRTRPPEGARDYWLEIEPGLRLASRLYTHDEKWPTILYFHGNGEVASDHDGIAPFYAGAGTNLYVVDFRGYGGSDGSPTFATLNSDARAVAPLAHALLDELGLTGPRFVMGRSMGAFSALEIAARAPARFNGLILESGAAGLRRMAGRFGVDPAAATQLIEAHEAKVRSNRLPVLMIHGEHDELIPLSSAAEIYGMFEGEGNEMLVITGAGHNDILWVGNREYFAAIRRFVERFGARTA